MEKQALCRQHLDREDWRETGTALWEVLCVCLLLMSQGRMNGRYPSPPAAAGTWPGQDGPSAGSATFLVQGKFRP